MTPAVCIYDSVEPENRLVAAELERRWEQTLRALVEAREMRDRFNQQPPEPALDPHVRAQLTDLSNRLPELWRDARVSPAHQKELLRSLIDQVIARRTAPDVIAVRIVWVSEAVTELSVRAPTNRIADVSGYEQLVARVLALSDEGYPDAEIARRVTAEGFHSAHNAAISPALVVRLRLRHESRSVLRRFTRQLKIDGFWTVYGLAQELGVNRSWVYTRIRKQIIPATCYRHSGCYVIEDNPDLIGRLRALVSAHNKHHP